MARQTEAPGVALRSLRQMSGMTLKEVAFAADTSISYLSKVERGEFAPSQEYVAKVAFVISRSMLPAPVKAKAA
ncbi:helix-turn-helix domain-containing protein [Microbacterium faecale]|nr:helix-turn-helix transcriptional regulator [Microbacterium faecale]